MNRREFIKNIAIAAGGVAGAVVLGGSVLSASETSEGKGKNKMKILVITGSPRKNGNSATLADHFIKGAKEAGHVGPKNLNLSENPWFYRPV